MNIVYSEVHELEGDIFFLFLSRLCCFFSWITSNLLELSLESDGSSVNASISLVFFDFLKRSRPDGLSQIWKWFMIVVTIPYLFGRWMFFSMTFFLFSVSSIGLRFFGAFFLGTLSLFLFRPALGALFGLMMVNGFLSFFNRWVWRLWTSRRVARIFSDRWWSWWCWIGFAVGFSSAISIIIITDVTNVISLK